MDGIDMLMHISGLRVLYLQMVDIRDKFIDNYLSGELS